MIITLFSDQNSSHPLQPKPLQGLSMFFWVLYHYISAHSPFCREILYFFCSTSPLQRSINTHLYNTNTSKYTQHSLVTISGYKLTLFLVINIKILLFVTQFQHKRVGYRIIYSYINTIVYILTYFGWLQQQCWIQTID